MATTLQQFIVETFSETELLILCDSDEQLQKVRAEFSNFMGLGEKVRRLIGFCKRYRLSSILWVKVKEERKEQWVHYQMPDNEPDSPVGQMRENSKDVEGIFRELKAIENMESQAVSLDEPVNNTHPLTQGDAEVKKWFTSELSTDEQVFVLTATIFSGLEKHEFMQFYNAINQGLQEDGSEKKKPAVFADEAVILEKTHLLYKGGERNTEYGLMMIKIIDFQDDEQRKKALKLLVNHYSRVVWKLLPVLRVFGAHPRTDVRYRAAQAVGELMCEMDFIRIKDEVILPWAKHFYLGINVNVSVAFSVVAKHEKYADNIKKLLKHWSTVSDSDLNRTALATSISLCRTWTKESIEIVRQSLGRNNLTPWDYSMLVTLSAFVLRELCDDNKTNLVIENLESWMMDTTAGVLRLGAALVFIDAIDLSHVIRCESDWEKVIHLYQVCLEDQRLDNLGLVRSSALGKLKAWEKVSFGDEDKEKFIKTLIKRVDIRSKTGNNERKEPQALYQTPDDVPDYLVTEQDDAMFREIKVTKAIDSQTMGKRHLKIFLCHASADKPSVLKIYDYLLKLGTKPWLDSVDLIPGQKWQVEIPKAISSSDVIIICLSNNSINKEGYFQKEIIFALDKALEMPDEHIFLIPIRFEECNVPSGLARYQWVNLFEKDGYSKLIKSLELRAQQLSRTLEK